MEQTNQKILTVNGGSSSIKFAVFERDLELTRITRGKIERIGMAGARFSAAGRDGSDAFSRKVDAPDHRRAVELLMDWVQDRFRPGELMAVGHRVVHGGARFDRPQRITAEIVHALHELEPFDPDHLPEEILLTEAFHSRFPGLLQIACFDTTFHREMPRVAQMLPLPRRYYEKGVRRFGFHGLSYTYLMLKLNELAGAPSAEGRVILAHLGNGASLAAVHGGKPVDTTMAFTPTAGIPMSTRSGDIDPGLVWFLARTEKMDVRQFHELVNHQSGLLGISELSSDIRDLLEAENADERAADAVATFCYAIKKAIGGLAAALGGLDTLVFSGGIGEHAPAIRARILAGLGFLGVDMDVASNENGTGLISSPDSRVQIWVIPTDEEWIIAKTVSELLASSRQ